MSERRQCPAAVALPAHRGYDRAIIGGWQRALDLSRWSRLWTTCLAVAITALCVPAFASADRYVYVSNGFPAGSNDISALHINSDGSLTPVSGSPFATGGTVTEGLSLTPDAQHLYVATFGSGDVRGFNVAAHGGLSAVSGSPFATGSTPLGTAPSPDGSVLFNWNHGRLEGAIHSGRESRRTGTSSTSQIPRTVLTARSRASRLGPVAS